MGAPHSWSLELVRAMGCWATELTDTVIRGLVIGPVSQHLSPFPSQSMSHLRPDTAQGSRCHRSWRGRKNRAPGSTLSCWVEGQSGHRPGHSGGFLRSSALTDFLCSGSLARHMGSRGAKDCQQAPLAENWEGREKSAGCCIQQQAARAPASGCC